MQAEVKLTRPHTPNVAAGGAKNEQGDLVSRRDVEVQTLLFRLARALFLQLRLIGEEKLDMEDTFVEFPDDLFMGIEMVADPTDGSANWLANEGKPFATTLCFQYLRKVFFSMVNLVLDKRAIWVGIDGVVRQISGDDITLVLQGYNEEIEIGQPFTATFRDFTLGELVIAYGTGKKMPEKARDALRVHLNSRAKNVELVRYSCLSASVIAVADGEVHAYVTGKERATNSNPLVHVAEKLRLEVKFYHSEPHSNEDQRMIFARPGFMERYVPDEGWLAKFLSREDFKEYEETVEGNVEPWA